MKTVYTTTKTWALSLAICCLAVVGSLNTLAAPGGAPANDDCSNAVAVTCGSTTTGTTVGATVDNAGTCVTSNTAPGVWYTFTGDGSDVTASLCTNTSYDSKLSVYTGSCGTFTCVTGNDDACSFQSEVEFSTLNGETYYILVHGFNSNTGPFELNLTCAAPANDLCADAVSIACGGSAIGATTAATSDASAVDCNLNRIGVWYLFSGTGDDITVSLDNAGTDYDTYLGISETCGGACVAFDDDGGTGLTSEIADFSTVSGQDYYIYVSGFSTNVGNYELTVTCVAPPTAPANDLCADAIALVCGDVVSGTTTGANTDAGETGATCGTSITAPGVWYTVDGTGLDITASLCGSSYDTKVSVFEGACGSLTCVGGNDDACGLQSELTWTSTYGTTYYVYVHGFGSATGDFDLAINCAAPANDLCADAEAITCGSSLTAYTTTAGEDGPGTSCIGSTLNGPDIWYSYTGIGQDVTVSLCGSDYDTKVDVYTDGCGTLTCVDGNDDACGLQSELTFYGAPGTEYLVRVHGWNGGTGEATLNVTCACPTITAGTLTADANPVCMVAGSATISATEGTAPTVPAGYAVVYVLTSGVGLDVEAVDASPSFVVNAAGDYTIHTLVFDPADQATLLAQPTGGDVAALLSGNGGTPLCGALDVTGAPITVHEEPSATISGGGSICPGETAPMQIDFTGTGPWDFTVDIDGQFQLTLNTSDNPFIVPANNPGTYTVLAMNDANCTGTTSGSATVTAIELSANLFSQSQLFSCNGSSVEAQIDFTGDGPWDVDLETPQGQTVSLTGITDNPYTLVLNSPQNGDYTLTNVSNAACASGDVSGTVNVTAEDPDAGTLTPDAEFVCFESPFVTVSATPDGNANVPNGYVTLYLLVDGNDILETSSSSSFAVTASGDYSILTLVYDPNTFNPSGYQIVSDITDDLAAFNICASLDETGASVPAVDCPANDLCGDAEAIACGGSATGSTLYATSDVDAVDCNAGRIGVWYVFTGTGDDLTVSLDNPGTDYDTYLGISETCGGVCVAFDDDGGTGLTSLIDGFPTVSGQDYYIYVSGFSTNVGNYEMTVTCATPPLPPANDDVCNAIPLSVGANGPFTNVAATAETDEPVPPAGTNGNPTCQSQDGWCSFELEIQNSIWFTFVAPASGSVTIDTDGSDDDTQLAVYSATSCQDFASGSAVLEGANDDNPDYIITIFSSIVYLCGLNPGETYFVQVDGYDGAEGDVLVNLVENELAADFTYSAAGLVVDFTDASTTSTSIVSWEWDFGDGNTSTDASPSHTYAADGPYTVCLTVTDENGCTNTYCEAIQVTDIPTTIAEAVERGMEVYPNPSNGEFIVQINGVEADVQIVVMDVAGRQVYNEGVTLNNSFRKELNLNVASGTYLLQITTLEGLVTRKLQIH